MLSDRTIDRAMDTAVDKTANRKSGARNLIGECIRRICTEPGARNLDVLVIGDVPGCSPFLLNEANVFFFKKVGRETYRWRSIEKLGEYGGILERRFDLVISNGYDESWRSFAGYSGVYLARVVKADGFNKGVIPEDGKLVALSEQLGGRHDVTAADFPDEVVYLLREGLRESEESERFFLPDLSRRFESLTATNSIELTAKGLKTDRATAGYLDFLNATLGVYNPVFTTNAGIIDSYHRFPSTALIAFDERLGNLGSLGFGVTEAPGARATAARLARKYEFLTTPLMELYPQQTLGYIRQGYQVAGNDVPDLGVVKGQSYFVRMGWRHVRVGDTKKGYLVIEVNGRELFENEEQHIASYIEAFGVPRVTSMADDYPGGLDYWKKQVRRHFPILMDFQAEDVALAATKPTVYFAHDRGLGKTLMAAAWARVRGYKRVLVCAQGKFLRKWEKELRNLGLDCETLLSWREVRTLKEKIRRKEKNSDTVYYLTSFEFLAMGETAHDPWSCLELDKNGNISALVEDIKSRHCPSCGKTYKQARKMCPSCGSREDYSGRYCRACKTATYSFKRRTALTPEKCEEISRAAEGGNAGFSSGSYPAYKKLRKLFSCVIVDEAQDVKNKRSLRSTAVRGLRSRGKALVTANLMKNYPNELFWPVGWLLGFNSPMFPYNYRGGFPLFERQFGTRLVVGVKPSGGLKYRQVPEVSNITLLWKLMAPFMVRRLKRDLKEIPDPDINVVSIEMDDRQTALYHAVIERKLEELAQLVESENPDVNVIGANLWSLKAASTIPTADRYFPPVDVKYQGVWAKLQWIVEKARELKAVGEKVIIYSTLVDMADAVHQALSRNGVSSFRIKQGVKDRDGIIDRFNADTTVALVSSMELIGRSFDIDGAKHVIFADMGWTPEEHEQAWDRAVRIRSRNKLTVYFLLCKETIDEQMFELVVQKGEAIKNVLDRRAVYQPTEVLREAVQLQVARRIIERTPPRLDFSTIPYAMSASSSGTEVMSGPLQWPVESLTSARQLSLFGDGGA